MTTRLLLVADTHLPKRAKDLPTEVWAAVDDADVVLHAGDWVDVALLDALESRARRLVGVAGNNDHGVLRDRLPEVARRRHGRAYGIGRRPTGAMASSRSGTTR